MQSTEQWLPIPGHEGHYEVSDHGNVRGVDRLEARGRRWKGKPISAVPHSAGYRYVNLATPGKPKVNYVHRLVLEAFVGPAPEGTEACHGNGVPHDNRLINLRWDTPSENSYDAVRHGTWKNQNVGKTVCVNGHALTGRNVVKVRTARRNTEARGCRACRLARTYAWRIQEKFDPVVADYYYLHGKAPSGNPSHVQR